MNTVLLTIQFILITLFGISQYIIPLQSKNGAKYIESVIDGVPIEFIFDTGATATLLSTEVFNKIKEKSGDYELLRVDSYQIADGSMVLANTYSADSLCLGTLCFKQIEFSVFQSENTSCLLGQNIFEKLYSYEIQSNQIRLTPRDYVGNDYYQKYSKETLIDAALMTFEALLDITFQSLTKLEYKISKAEYSLDKYDSTINFKFEVFSIKNINDIYSKSKYYTACEKFTKEILRIVLFDIIKDKNLLDMLLSEIIALKIDEIQFNICLTFANREHCFNRTVYCDQFIENKTFNSITDIDVY